MSSTPIIEVKNLEKHFKETHAVKGISFSIPHGQCLGILGPNGAGKSTTIEMIEGITEATSGEILYCGEPRGIEFKESAGIQFQSTALMQFLTVRDQLKLFSELYKNSDSIESLIERCQLEDYIDKDASKLSGGQRQRLLLAIALVNKPQILFLDEPTAGLDPQSRSLFWELINDIKAQGKTIVITTHYMDEAQSLCDELLVMDGGEIIAKGSPKQLLREHFDHVLITLNESAITDETKQLSTIEYQRIDDGISFNSNNVEQTISQLIEQGVSLETLQVRSPTLDDLFLKLTGHHLMEETEGEAEADESI